MVFETQENETQERMDNLAFGRTSSYELEGSIPELSRSAAALRTILTYPPKKNSDIRERENISSHFIFSVSHVFQLSKEILDEDIKNRYKRWINASINDYPNDIQFLHEGLQIEEDIQEILFRKGYKDTNRPQPIPFPMEVYRRG